MSALDPRREMPETRTTRLQIERILAQTYINPANLRLVSRVDEYTEALVIEAVRRVAYVPADPKLLVPADWWEHLKQRWFPRWALRRWPVRLRTYEARAYFPRIDASRGLWVEHYYFDWKEIEKDG